MLVFKRFGHQIHLMVQKEAKRCGIEFMGGPQGQVVRFLDNREKNQDLVLIKDMYLKTFDGKRNRVTVQRGYSLIQLLGA